MSKADDAAKSRALDRAIVEVMTTLRNASPPLVPEALEVVERIEAEIAARRQALDDHLPVDWHRAGPSATIAQAGDNVLTTAAEIEDPIDRARALQLAIAVVPDVGLQLRRARAEAIAAALKVHSATFVAGELGMSRARLHQALED